LIGVDARHKFTIAPQQSARKFLLAAFRLSRDQSVRFPDSPGFITSVFQAFVRDFRPKLF
jgi:hypothetical protein